MKSALIFVDNTWGADLPDMQLISKCNNRFWFSLCVIGTYSKYTWNVPLKGTTITNANLELIIVLLCILIIKTKIS